MQSGAFKASVKAQKGKVPLFWNHDVPIGTALVAEDEKGLHTVGSPLVNDVVAAREGMALVKAGAVRGMSVGYIARASSRDEKTGVRTIKTADLLEVSLVPFGMNPAATVTSVKSLAEFADAVALAAALVEGKTFDPDFAEALALLAFPRVSSSLDESEAKAALESLNALLEEMKP